MFKNIFYTVLFSIFSCAYAQTASALVDNQNPNSVDCIILQDENSIICKLEVKRLNQDRDVKILWIDPKNKVSRERDMVIPAGHGSIYDYRYIKGRMLGTWTFKAIVQDQEVQTNFTLTKENQ
jgi:hypothetical protein